MLILKEAIILPTEFIIQSLDVFAFEYFEPEGL